MQRGTADSLRERGPGLAEDLDVDVGPVLEGIGTMLGSVMQLGLTVAPLVSTAPSPPVVVGSLAKPLAPPSRTVLSGPEGASIGLSVELADHPAEHLDPREEAARLRRWAGRLESMDLDPALDPAGASGREGE